MEYKCGKCKENTIKITKKAIESKYLAFGLSWLGFDYTEDSTGRYVFEETKKFRRAWTEMHRLRREIREEE